MCERLDKLEELTYADADELYHEYIGSLMSAINHQHSHWASVFLSRINRALQKEAEIRQQQQQQQRQQQEAQQQQH
eukprot:1279001-Amphidinium_carterae.1